MHALTFQLVEEGLVDGLRVDHIDGLLRSKGVLPCIKGQVSAPDLSRRREILAPHEQLRTAWDVEGTTGYEFAGAVTRLLTDRASEQTLTETYQRFTGRTEGLDDVERESRLGIIDFEMAAELDALTTRLRRSRRPTR